MASFSQLSWLYIQVSAGYHSRVSRLLLWEYQLDCTTIGSEGFPQTSNVDRLHI